MARRSGTPGYVNAALIAASSVAGRAGSWRRGSGQYPRARTAAAWLGAATMRREDLQLA
jgi:hypothetical protein